MNNTNDITGDRLVTKPSAQFEANIGKVDFTWIREQVKRDAHSKANCANTSRRRGNP